MIFYYLSCLSGNRDIFMTLKSSFAPLVNANAQILILGSLPGDLSLIKQEYYAHPQNRFWKVLFQVHQVNFSASYEIKKQLLSQNHIALWDICATAFRIGSMDTDIQHVEANAIHGLLLEFPNIQKIVFNGKKAQQLYDKHFDRLETIQYKTLPSTSPANATWNLEKLCTAWKDALSS